MNLDVVCSHCNGSGREPESEVIDEVCECNCEDELDGPEFGIDGKRIEPLGQREEDLRFNYVKHTAR